MSNNNYPIKFFRDKDGKICYVATSSACCFTPDGKSIDQKIDEFINEMNGTAWITNMQSLYENIETTANGIVANNEAKINNAIERALSSGDEAFNVEIAKKSAEHENVIQTHISAFNREIAQANETNNQLNAQVTRFNEMYSNQGATFNNRMAEWQTQVDEKMDGIDEVIEDKIALDLSTIMLGDYTLAQILLSKYASGDVNTFPINEDIFNTLSDANMLKAEIDGVNVLFVKNAVKEAIVGSGVIAGVFTCNNVDIIQGFHEFVTFIYMYNGEQYLAQVLSYEDKYLKPIIEDDKITQMTVGDLTYPIGGGGGGATLYRHSISLWINQSAETEALFDFISDSETPYTKETLTSFVDTTKMHRVCILKQWGGMTYDKYAVLFYDTSVNAPRIAYVDGSIKKAGLNVNYDIVTDMEGNLV